MAKQKQRMLENKGNRRKEKRQRKLKVPRNKQKRKGMKETGQ
jgi:hypothetical protein